MKSRVNIKACLLAGLILTATSCLYSQPVPAPPPAGPIPPYSTLPAPNLPPLRIVKPETQLVKEYRELTLARQTLSDQITSQSKKVTDSKTVLRNTTNPVKKWLDRKDFQEQVQKLRGLLQQLNNTDKRLQEIRNIAMERKIDLPDKPDKEETPYFYRNPAMRENRFMHPPQMPMGTRFSEMTAEPNQYRGKGKGNNAESPQRRLERLRKQQVELDKLNQQIQDEIDTLKDDKDTK